MNELITIPLAEYNELKRKADAFDSQNKKLIAEDEIFVKIQNHQDYEISNYGRVYSIKMNKIIKANENGKGRLRVGLMKNGKQYRYLVHRLVATAFIPNPNNKPEVNHINLNPRDNHYSNLEWCTNKENILHFVRSGKMKVRTGEANNNSKLKEVEAIKIISLTKELPIKDIIKLFPHISHVTVRGVAQGWKWKHLHQKLKTGICPIGKNKKREVIQYFEGNIVARYKSASDAQKHTGFSASGISSCARGELNHFRGYQWKTDKDTI